MILRMDLRQEPPCPRHATSALPGSAATGLVATTAHFAVKRNSVVDT